MMTVDGQSNKAAESLVANQQSCLDITVVIPTYNGGERVPQVLDRLKQQVDIDNLAWEVIVCDNNSCDRTADIVSEYQQNWLSQRSLRYCFVAEQGAAYARQRGVTEAGGKIVAFLDDDNIPAHDWLSQVQRFADTHPQAGAFGSQIHGDFQGALPEGFEHIACFLAIVERGNSPHLYRPSSKILPPAAGLAVLKEAWIAAVPERLFLNHKGKSAGLASEDLEAMLHIQKAGWEIWYNSDMVVTHQIPGERLQREYLVKLLRCVGLSRFYIRWLGTQDWQRLFKVPAYVANDLRRLALHYLKYRSRQADLNVVAVCERSLLTSTLLSPVFLVRKAYGEFWQARLDNAQLPDRQKWLRHLTDALESGQLNLYKQEVVFLGDEAAQDVKQLNGPQFEVLLRLRQGLPGKPLVYPASFLPTAERYGLMRTLDRRVLKQVLRALSTEEFNGIYSLNLAEATVRDPDFLMFVEQQLQCYAVRPENLCFEISASVVAHVSQQLRPLMKGLKDLGIRVVVDEMADSVSSAQYIEHLPVDCIKLSKALLMPAAQSDQLLGAWVKVSRQWEIQLVAKGVETAFELEQLRSLGIQYAQGYHLAEPNPLSVI